MAAEEIQNNNQIHVDIANLQQLIYKFYQKYHEIEDHSNVSDDNEYITLFDNALKDTDDVFYADFILPDGKLKKFELDLSNFQMPEIYKTKYGFDLDIIYTFIRLNHEQIKLLGFDLDRILKLGCIRIAHGIKEGEMNIFMDLTKKLDKKTMEHLENILLNSQELYIEYFNVEEEDYACHTYSSKNGDTIKNINKDINMYLKQLNNQE